MITPLTEDKKMKKYIPIYVLVILLIIGGHAMADSLVRFLSIGHGDTRTDCYGALRPQSLQREKFFGQGGGVTGACNSLS